MDLEVKLALMELLRVLSIDVIKDNDVYDDDGDWISSYSTIDNDDKLLSQKLSVIDSIAMLLSKPKDV